MSPPPFISYNLADNLGSTFSTRCRERSFRRSRIPVSDAYVFRRFITNFIMSTSKTAALSPPLKAKDDDVEQSKNKASTGLKKIPPYWYPYTTMAKGRWLGREILEVVSTEFRDRSMEFYVRTSSYEGPSSKISCGIRALVASVHTTTQPSVESVGLHIAHTTRKTVPCMCWFHQTIISCNFRGTLLSLE